MAVQKAQALTEYINSETGDLKYKGGGGGGGGSTTKTTSSTPNLSSSNYQITNISSSHPLYPGIIGSNTQCSLFPTNTKVYIIDGNKLSGEGATYFNNGKVWHTHYFNNTTYELTYYNNTYWYKIKGAIANVSNTNNTKTTNKSALESLLKITEVLKSTLVEENSIQVDETIKEEPVKTISTPISYTTTTSTSYLKTKTILPKDKTTIEVVKNNLEVINNKQDKKTEINFNDLISKGKLSFQTKINVSYSYSYNLVNIIPNPLYNELINDKYNDTLYATSDLNGECNTSYLKLNKQNIVNNISKNYYLPSIGELGISMENIQIINDSIDALGEEYSDCKIPYDAIIASSSLYSSTPISNENYHITNNLNNVWCFNNKDAEITYKPISNKFTIIPFYKFQNNMVINLDEEVEDVVINSIITIELASLNYYEKNSPIHNFKVPNITEKNKVSDFNISNWLEHPFSSKYFFNILFPEVQDYISLDDNFTNLHDDYLSYYIYYSHSKQYDGHRDINNNYNIEISDSTSKPSYSYYNIEDNTYCQKDIQSNNGILMPSYISNHITYTIYEKYGIEGESVTFSYQIGKNLITYTYFSRANFIDNDTSQVGPKEVENYSYAISTNTNDFWKQYLIYNTIVYNNHIILMPIIGSGENNYNFKKNKAKVLFYISIPSSCTNFTCKMNNTTDCNINISKYETIKGFDIYCINLIFKEDTPTDNVLIFSCKYQNKTITKKYFYSIYSLTWSGPLNNNYTSYFSINNYYVAKDPYYWWDINKWDKRYSNWTAAPRSTYSFYVKNGKTFDYATSYSYVYYDSFGKLFDNSYTISNIRFLAYFTYNNSQMESKVGWSYVTLESYTTTTYNQSKYHNKFSDLSYSYFNIMYDMSYMINHIGRNIGSDNHGTVLERGLRVDRIIDNDVKYSNKISKINYKKDGFISIKPYAYCYYISNLFKPTHDYHLFTINTYFNVVSSINNNYYNKKQQITEGPQYFQPIVRINRTVDEFGVYNDLIFLDPTKSKHDEKIYEVTNSGLTNTYIYTGTKNYYYDENNQPKSTKWCHGFTIDGTNYLKYKQKGAYPSANVVFDEFTILYPNGPENFSENGGCYNTFNLNIPIVGAKQSICLGLDMIEYIKSGIFKSKKNGSDTEIFNYYNYVFSDYLFLYNNTNGVVTLLISDPSLSLVNKQHALIQLKPKELKIYYPNNFNYSITSNHDIIENKKIYDIKLVNKSTNIKNIIFKHYKLGELNKSFDNIKSNNDLLVTQKGFKFVTYLMWLNYIGSNDIYNKFNELYFGVENGALGEVEGIELQDRNRIESQESNEINIGIKNYIQNNAGHLIIINTNKIIKEDLFYKKYTSNKIDLGDNTAQYNGMIKPGNINDNSHNIVAG